MPPKKQIRGPDKKPCRNWRCGAAYDTSILVARLQGQTSLDHGAEPPLFSTELSLPPEAGRADDAFFAPAGAEDWYEFFRDE